ncbi:hypothetical protein ACSBR2_018937 [Camellia fascicularis]
MRVWRSLQRFLKGIELLCCCQEDIKEVKARDKRFIFPSLQRKKLVDMARFVDHEKGSQTTILAGPMGYLAPECVVTGKASKESNVYSFRVVALEIACRRKPFDLKIQEKQIIMVEWVWDLYGT